ncbi:hypothetical protein OV208_37400 [Corallococcus sp. bb12-1]|uniref:hypothetical protein n=1 Tax=Corallococcus sp. bb12-1 TaxID=2996784 RepID=UPI00226FB4D5|nr:hypothetical protein [Corallococcus sp. bb12-1]MCY1047038.1 hypothetical protein [Corallococcus sp. bb12-1]
MAELAAKLHEPLPPIKSWNGSVLEREDLAELGLESEPKNAPESLLSDGLLDSAWAASQHGRSEGGRRGLLIEGAPGAGKSILSRVLEQRFRFGLLGTLGFGVRLSARDLVEGLRRASSRTWSSVLSMLEPGRRTLFEELERTARLVPIVDGLDELGGVQLREVASWLREGSGWWVATTRPAATFLAALPRAWRLRVREPSTEDGRKLLTGAGRTDLAQLLYGEREHPSRLPDSLAALTRTPLHLSLLAQVFHEGESLELPADHKLYQRVFEGLLEQACQEQRLTEQDARRLRGLRGDVLGELALAWLRDPGGPLEGSRIDQLLDAAGFTALERPELLRALEFGHLLAPAGDTWDFAHRTVAEWAASEALSRKVVRQQQQHAGTSDAGLQGARIELEVLAPFLEAGGGVWSQLLRFYAPHLKEPLAFLHRLTQARRPLEHTSPVPSSRHSRPATDALASWNFTFELLAQAVWTRPRDARLAWGIAVRRWLLFEHDGEEPFIREQRDLSALKSFAQAVAIHLPRALPELFAIAGKTEAQRARLRTEPTLLLPAIPPGHASSLDPLLRGDSRKARRDVLEWYAQHGLEVDGDFIDTLIDGLPAEVTAAEAAAREEWRERQHEGPHASLPRRADSTLLEHLEVLVWEARLRMTQGLLPWSRVRVRLQGWPRHLEGVILRWFGMRSGEPTSESVDLENQHRRDVLAASLGEVSQATRQLVRELNRLRETPEGLERVAAFSRWLSDSEDHHLPRLLGELVARVGLELPGNIWREEDSPSLKDGLRRLKDLRRRLAAMVKALDETRLGPVLGGLWVLLSPEQPEHKELLQVIVEGQRPPPQVPVRLMLDSREDSLWTLEQIVWAPSHLVQLRELATSGPGALRFVAILLLAKLEKRDEILTLLQAMPSADGDLLERIREHISGRMNGAEHIPTQLLPPGVRVQLPLEERVEREVPGWRIDLIAHLAEPANDMASLATLAARKGVREALPLLGARLEGKSWPDRAVIKAIALLCTPADARWARVALHQALLHGWPDGRAERHVIRHDKDAQAPAGDFLARFLTIEDLDLLVQGRQSALPHPSLAEAIRGLGPDARERLLNLYREASEAVRHLGRHARTAEWSQPSPTEEERTARQRRIAIAETLIASFDPTHGGLSGLVDLAFQVAGGDVHHVYGMTGPLGSDFDAPSDLDWYSDQENAALTEALGRRLGEWLAHKPLAWPEVRRLFLHPSETLRLRAFELCAEHAPPHEVAQLALDALEGQVRANLTRWTGATLAYRLSGGGGAGNSYVDSPDTPGRLARAVRNSLTPVHRQLIETLTGHALPLFRLLAAQWTGQLGDASWVALLLPLFADPVPGVVLTAFDALLLIAPEQLEDVLRQADRSGWTSHHDTGVFERLRTPEKAAAPIERWLTRDESTPVAPLKYVTVSTVEVLLAEAAHRSARSPDDARPSSSPFKGFPTPVEELCHRLWKDAPPGPASALMLEHWSQHPLPDVRVVARRLRASHGLLSFADVLPLLSGTPIEQLSAAECLVRLADEPHLEAASAFWRAMLGPERRTALWVGMSMGWREPPARLMWALEGASPAFAPLLGLVANQIPYDSEEGMDTPEGGHVVQQTLQVVLRWGESGVMALLKLMEDREVEDHYDFLELVKATALQSRPFRERLHEQAVRSWGPASKADTEVREEIARMDLAGLMHQLASEVFPEGWLKEGVVEPEAA